MKPSEGKETMKCWWAQPLDTQHDFRKKVLKYTMSLVSLSKYMSCFTYIFPSYQQAGFSEGVLASTKQKRLQCSAKHPGSINHGCWITLGVPQVCFHMLALWFYYDSNMVKRCSVSSIDDSYHRHGSSTLFYGTKVVWRIYSGWLCFSSTPQSPAIKRKFTLNLFCWSGPCIFILFFLKMVITESQQGGAEWSLYSKTAVHPQ